MIKELQFFIISLISFMTEKKVATTINKKAANPNKKWISFSLLRIVDLYTE